MVIGLDPSKNVTSLCVGKKLKKSSNLKIIKIFLFWHNNKDILQINIYKILYYSYDKPKKKHEYIHTVLFIKQCYYLKINKKKKDKQCIIYLENEVFLV